MKVFYTMRFLKFQCVCVVYSNTIKILKIHFQNYIFKIDELYMSIKFLEWGLRSFLLIFVSFNKINWFVPYKMYKRYCWKHITKNITRFPKKSPINMTFFLNNMLAIKNSVNYPMILMMINAAVHTFPLRSWMKKWHLRFEIYGSCIFYMFTKQLDTSPKFQMLDIQYNI